jgi:Bardet-Biedl syndrome 9 protein
VSKQGGRFRVQADAPWALALLVCELERRIMRAQAAEGTAGAGQAGRRWVVCNDALHVEPLLALTEPHLTARLLLEKSTSTLNDRCHQYRMVQKRLLSRYRERNPSDLNGLDELARSTYDDIMLFSEKCSVLTRILRVGSAALQSAANLLSLQTFLRFPHLSRADAHVLRAHLCSGLTEGVAPEDGQGWLESASAGLAHLLRTRLARVPKVRSCTI